MAERFKAAVLKTVVPLAAEPWVRILLPPPKLVPRCTGLVPGFWLGCDAPDAALQRKINDYGFTTQSHGEMAESAEGARLLSECGG